MGKKAIEVIIPIYNGEKFIDSIINTLEKQTFKNFSVVFVDDGSTDNSLNVLKERLVDVGFEHKVVHKENGGLSTARNTGVNSSDSEWITFIDCDDKLDPHFLEYLHRSVTENNTLVGCCEFQGIPFDKQERIKPVSEYDCEVVSAEQFMKDYYINWVGACCFIVNREWLISKDLLFYDECTYCEDIPFITRVVEAADRISHVKNALYLYLLRQGSLIRSPKIEKYQVGITAFLKMAEEMDGKETAAAKVFQGVGRARYMLATLRKGAVQLSFKSFKALSEMVDTEMLKGQIKNLNATQKLAGYMYLISKTAFYFGIRFIFKD